LAGIAASVIPQHDNAKSRPHSDHADKR
jgi:hypothetical protein